MKPKKLNKGDKVAIVSLSRGLLGMPFCKHELELGIKRLKEFGLEPVIMPNADKDMEYLEKHPEKRAEDLKEAFKDKEIKAIINAIGGEDTYKTIPYLMEDEEFKEIIKENPKIFMGFSDTTNNHLMLNRLGLSTFYGPCFLIDIAELDKEMLPYTKKASACMFRQMLGMVCIYFTPSRSLYRAILPSANSSPFVKRSQKSYLNFTGMCIVRLPRIGSPFLFMYATVPATPPMIAVQAKNFFISCFPP